VFATSFGQKDGRKTVERKDMIIIHMEGKWTDVEEVSASAPDDW
jgi:uncharacterized protein YbcI